MKRELMKLVEEMRESINSPYWPRDDHMIDWSDRLEAIAKAHGEEVATVYRDDYGDICAEFAPDFYVEDGAKLYTAPPSPAADVLVEALKEIAAADQGEGGCYYTNRSNIELARNALAAYEKERQK